ncbi:sulfatase family protein [Nocardioides currus]|uniref:sulfatase family protein n=1 Tax=Nocardioides currus TaxID=2133958 RepID=UPI001402CFD4|nr:sulfatase [Nocardioides currus]
MSRPPALAVTLLLLAGVVLAGCSGKEAAAPAASPPPATSGVRVGDQPNIVLITSDDQTKPELKWMPQTRQLLGRTGVTFNNMIAPHPNCCPARAQILSGEYAQNNGVRTNSPPWGGHEGFDPDTALPLWLQEAGYRTGFIGKYMHGYDQDDGIEPGWDEWKPIVGTLSDYRSFLQYDNGQLVQFTESDYYTDVVAQQSTDLVTQFSSTGQPFFLWSSFIAPHGTCQGNSETDCSGPPPAADRHAGLLGDVVLPSLSAPSFNEADRGDKPRDVQELPEVVPAEQQTIYTARLRTLAALDEAVAGIVSALDAAGTLDDTVILFTSDNGYLFGEHRLVGKNVPYEESLRVPLVMRGPEIPAGERRKQIVSMTDLAPTIAELAKAEPMVEIDGRSLLGYAVEDRRQRDRGLLIQAGSKGKDKATAWKWRGVRTKRYTLVRWQRPRFVELYDRTTDPYQLTNVALDPDYRQVRRALADYLDVLEDCAGPKCRTLVPKLPEPGVR